MRLSLAFLVLLACAAPVRADEEHSFWWYTKAKVACLPDVMKLCSSAMPDEEKVKDCMKDKKAVVSASCAEFYPGGKNAE